MAIKITWNAEMAFLKDPLAIDYLISTDLWPYQKNVASFDSTDSSSKKSPNLKDRGCTICLIEIN